MVDESVAMKVLLKVTLALGVHGLVNITS